MEHASESTPTKPQLTPMSRGGWIGIAVAGLGSAAVALWINWGHPNWSAEDFSKIAGLWTALFAALAAAWISHLNAERQIKSSKDLAAQQVELQQELQDSTAKLQNDLARLNASLALNLEEAKVQIANRYQAQVALNQVAMAAADRIHELQRGASGVSEAQKLLDQIREASAAMQSNRGALLMVPEEYRDAWEKLQQQVVYIEERIAQEIVKTPSPDLRSFYSLPAIGGTFADLWQKFNQVAAVKTRPSS